VIIKNLSKKDNGKYSFELEVTDEEAKDLLHFAVEQLIMMGLIDIGEEETIVEDEIDNFINNGGKLS